MRSNLIQLGRTIRAKRTDAKMTLQQVAEKAGISTGLVSKIENFRTVPSLPILLKLAAALDVTMADLVKDVSTDEEYVPFLVICGARGQPRLQLRIVVQQRGQRDFVIPVVHSHHRSRRQT